MFSVKIDGITVYHPNLAELSLVSAIVLQDIDRAGTFTMTMPPQIMLITDLKRS